MLSIYWPHPKVQYQGTPISQAWAGEMARLGWEIKDTPEGADFAFFVSESQLDDSLIGKLPTICYYWGVPPHQMLDYGFKRPYNLKQVERMRACTRVLVPSPTTLDQAFDLGLPAQLCYSGVDARRLSVNVGPSPALQADLVWIGRYDAPEKNLGFLFEALTMLKPPPSLLVIGPGNPAPYQRYASQAGLSVTFAQLSDEDKVRAIRQARLLVHTSEYEGFGLPPLEAQYLGTPVLALDTPHMRWLLQEQAGYVNSPQALAQAIADLSNRDQEIREITAVAAKRIANVYTLEHAARRLWEHLHQVHKLHWAGVLRKDPTNPAVIKQVYEQEHKRNRWYHVGSAPGYPTIERFDPTWSRHWRAQSLLKALHDAGAQRIVDIGCSEVYPTIEAKDGFDVTAVDVSETALETAMEIAKKWGVADKVHTQQAWAQHLPFAHESFDSAVLGEILEHVPDPDVVLAEAYRVVKPGGVVVCSTPFGHHHFDPMHIASEDGGWHDDMVEKLLAPYKNAGKLVSLDKIAEEGTEPSCYFWVIRK